MTAPHVAEAARGSRDARAPELPGAPAASRRRALAQLLLRGVRRPEAGGLIGTVVVYLFFLVAAGGGFTSGDGTASWLNVAAELGIASIPVSLLLISGEFDLSIGAVLGASSLTVAIGSGHYGLPLWLSIVMALALSAGVGLLNGVLRVRTDLPSFVVTLATWLVLSGASLAIARAVTGTTTVALSDTGVLHTLFAGSVGQFQVSILWWLGLVALGGWALARTVFGNWVYAIGGDARTAREAGIPVHRVKVALFVCAALGAGLVGVIQAIEFNGANVGQGEAFVFDTIIAAVIGGVLLTGGYGSALGVMLGTMTYGIVSVGIFYTGWSSDWAQAILGGLLLVAVVSNNFFRRLASRSA